MTRTLKRLRIGLGYLKEPKPVELRTDAASYVALTRMNSDGEPELLMVRGNDGQPALPGGFLFKKENPQSAADRRKAAQRMLWEQAEVRQDLAKAEAIHKGPASKTKGAAIETVYHAHVPWRVGKLLVPRAGIDVVSADWRLVSSLDPHKMTPSQSMTTTWLILHFEQTN